MSSHRWRGLRPNGKTLPDGTLEPGRPIIVNCHGSRRGRDLRDCLDDFRRVLADVPHLLDDLDVAISGDVEFVEHGIRGSDGGLSKASGANPAVAAHQRLVRALDTAAGWFDSRHPEQLARLLLQDVDQLVDEPALRKVAREVSSAAARAHRVIDAPADLWYYGPCPECGADLLQERIWKHDADGLVSCRRCEYAAPVDDHQRRILVEGEDSLADDHRARVGDHGRRGDGDAEADRGLGPA